MKIALLRRVAALLFILLAVAPRMAGAHAVWLEPLADGTLGVRFAEPDGKAETSPGRLDGLTLPVAVTEKKDEAATRVEVSKKSDHFLLAGASVTDPACAETSHAVMALGGKPARLPIFYARWCADPAVAASPALTLDIVPTGKPGEAKVYFRGQPLAGARATVHSEEADTEVTADAEGVIHYEAKKAGQYLLVVRHSEKLAGFHAGKRYEVASHNSSLTLRLK